ncbi:MAG TPA: cobalamin-dependent protein, partial [Longimicrobium sp.]
EIGRGWSERTIGIAQEHLACATLRRVLGFAADAAEVRGDAPLAVIATPARHVHEMGALLAAVSAAAAGWQITYLGADVPAEEIAGAARQKNAALVALSVVNPGSELDFAEELRMLRANLPPGVGVLLGGAGACIAPELLAEADAVWLPTLADFRHALRRLAVDGARRSLN